MGEDTGRALSYENENDPFKMKQLTTVVIITWTSYCWNDKYFIPALSRSSTVFVTSVEYRYGPGFKVC